MGDTSGRWVVCQGNFEVGDPLSGTLFPSVTLEQLHLPYAGARILLRGSMATPSIGTGSSEFSNNDTFTGTQMLCPPGGT